MLNCANKEPIQSDVTGYLNSIYLLRKATRWKTAVSKCSVSGHCNDCAFFHVPASQTSSDTTTTAGDDASLEEKPAKKSKKGKKVQWPADDANLATFHFFEMDEDERG